MKSRNSSDLDVRLILMTEPEFINHYPTIPNHLDPEAWPCRFGTTGDQLVFVREQNPRCVWTLVEYEGVAYILSGVHYKNSMGYYVSTTPRPEGVAVRVSPASYMVLENEPDPRIGDGGIMPDEARHMRLDQGAGTHASEVRSGQDHEPEISR